MLIFFRESVAETAVHHRSESAWKKIIDVQPPLGAPQAIPKRYDQFHFVQEQ